MYLFVAALLAWTPPFGDGTIQAWADIACRNETFNGVRWQPFYSEPDNRSVTIERKGDVVKVELWSNKPRELVAEATTECKDD